jgi:tRNA(fMet)-specific endonuclease VapC
VGMRRILIDTNIYVAFKRNDSTVIKAFQSCDLIGIDVSVLAELYSGFQLGKKTRQNYTELETFLNHIRVQIFNHNIETSEFFSQIYKKLRIKGKPIPTNDIWIASVAMQHGLALYSKDRHFMYVDGLILYEI